MTTISNLENKLIVGLAEIAVSGELSEEFNEAAVIWFFDNIIGPAAIRAVFSELSKQGFVRQISVNPKKYEITMELLRKAEEIKESDNTLEEIFGDELDGLSIPTFEELPSAEQNDRALDEIDVWEPLPLEASETEVAEVAGEVEELIEAVRIDNGYAATHPEEQKSILWALGSGANALREGLVTRFALENFLRNPLKKLMERFPDAAIQISAQKLLEKIIGLFSGGGG